MPDTELVEVAEFFLAILILGFGYLFMYGRTRCDQFREDLFTIRDDLFDYMWKHDLSFDMLAYTLMRDSINGMIRSAHVMRPGLFLLSRVFIWNRHKSPVVREAVENIQCEDVRAHFKSVYWQIGRRAFSFLCLEGTQFVFFWPFHMVMRLNAELRRRASNPRCETPRFDRVALELRDEILTEMAVLGKPNSPEARYYRRVAPVLTR